MPEQDAVAIARLRAAGAVIFGKTNVPEFASDSQSFNALFGVTNNPWDATRTPGGSSGGSAAAVAAGLTAFELGSDLGGSLRIPAHFCGVYTIKPTWGIVPNRGHIPPPPGSLVEMDVATAGPLTRSARDLDLVLPVLAGPDAPASLGWRLNLASPSQRSLANYRIAVWLDDPYSPTDADSTAQLHGLVELLRKAGAQVDEAARPGVTLEEMHDVAQRLIAGLRFAVVPGGGVPGSGRASQPGVGGGRFATGAVGAKRDPAGARVQGSGRTAIAHAGRLGGVLRPLRCAHLPSHAHASVPA